MEILSLPEKIGEVKIKNISPSTEGKLLVSNKRKLKENRVVLELMEEVTRR